MKVDKNPCEIEILKQLASTNAVVLFSTSGDCICTVAKRLLFGLGVAPVTIELDSLLLRCLLMGSSLVVLKLSWLATLMAHWSLSSKMLVHFGSK
ncbi:hypothetical protein V6N13_132587 [Hibiscus sabdariffa]|uniref:Glutaredoxin domain-containing protein n=1 Tax=Hibiscus sabdariffa TaxID=183260 RepID=A0ABR2PVV9_9ROSI